MSFVLNLNDVITSVTLHIKITNTICFKLIKYDVYKIYLEVGYAKWLKVAPLASDEVIKDHTNPIQL